MYMYLQCTGLLLNVLGAAGPWMTAQSPCLLGYACFSVTPWLQVCLFLHFLVAAYWLSWSLTSDWICICFSFMSEWSPDTFSSTDISSSPELIYLRGQNFSEFKIESAKYRVKAPLKTQVPWRSLLCLLDSFCFVKRDNFLWLSNLTYNKSLVFQLSVKLDIRPQLKITRN